MRRISVIAGFLLLALGISAAPRHLTSRTAVAPDFVHFESGHVHPACMTPSGDRLLVVNTSDGRLTVFDLTGAQPSRIAEIPVGLEPVSVAALNDSVAWVVNNLSDDVSIVSLATMHVKATLRVGDEPSDVVFAGTPNRAYVSVSQEDQVKVYDPGNLAAAPAVVSINGRMPRALARDASGDHVYVAVFHAGNRTSVLSEAKVPNDSLPSDPQFPRDPSLSGHVRPQTGLMVQQQPDGNWRDMYGKLWNYRIKYSMHEVDVAEISTATGSVSRSFGDLGAVNFSLAVSPGDGRIAVTATEALNAQRLEPRLKGHMVDTQVGFITASGSASVRNLNPHVNYAVLPGTQAELDSAIGIPTGVAFSANGLRAYATSLASDRLAVLDPAGGPASTVLARVPTVPGPTGVVVDDARGRIYVVGRFRNQLQTLSTANLSQIAVAGIGFDPTPDDIVNGRRFFYGGFTSAHGDQACASCHVFGDFDNLAWDLGNPSGSFQPPPPGMIAPLEGFDPEKGPMTTQSLRGLPNTGLLHWRGDRANLNAFNPAFVGLMGRTTQLPDSEMAAFSSFVLALAYPPNPTQLLGRTMPTAPAGQPSALRGETFFLNTRVDGPFRCVDCHTLPTGTNGQIVNDDALLEDQDIKIPQLRNMYKKTGFTDAPGVTNTRGFGFIHDGSVDNLFNFLNFPGFNFGSPQSADANRRDVEAFLLAFDTGMAPAVGYQVTFDGTNTTDSIAVNRMTLLMSQANGGHCDLMAKGRGNGQPRGWLYQGANLWRPDKQAETSLTSEQLRSIGWLGSEVTVTGVPAGSGERMGLDRDRDGYFDGDELDAHSDPGNPLSTPANAGVLPGARSGFAMRGVSPNPFSAAIEISFTLGRAGPVDCTVYDVLGREVRSVARGLWLEAGPQSVKWDGRSGRGAAAPPGAYFVRVKTDGGQWARPVFRVR